MNESGVAEKVDADTHVTSNRTLSLAVMGVLAGVYAVATIALGTISYGVLNLRLTNLIIAVVPILGFPSVVGLSLGVFLSDIASPLGPIDLITCLFAFVGLYVIHLLKNKSVAIGLAAHSTIIALWVTFELSLVLSIPYFPLFYFVLAGNCIVNALAYVLYRALVASGFKNRFAPIWIKKTK